MKIELTDADLDEMREIMEGVIDFVPTDRELRLAVANQPGILALAVEWGWHDTEIREQLAPALEEIHS